MRPQGGLHSFGCPYRCPTTSAAGDMVPLVHLCRQSAGKQLSRSLALFLCLALTAAVLVYRMSCWTQLPTWFDLGVCWFTALAA